MPENQASTLELLVTVTRGGGALQRQVEDQLRAQRMQSSGNFLQGNKLMADVNQRLRDYASQPAYKRIFGSEGGTP